MAVKVISPTLLLGCVGIFLMIALSQAKSEIDIQEKPTLNQTITEQKKRGGGFTLRSSCIDKYTSCPAWASYGYCQRYYVDWMAKNCPKSCNKCPCEDQYRNCPVWASFGYCERYYVDWIAKNCKKSCNVCSSCKCGQANRGNRNKIVGGNETKENEYPWQVLLNVRRGTKMYICGGSIISSKEILTAAHCVCYDRSNRVLPKEDVRIMVGTHTSKVDLFKDPPPAKVYKLCKTPNVHESYNPSSLDYDFAILSLCEDLEFSQEISPVCLPESAGQDPGLNENVDTIISGWGLTSGGGELATFLQEITVKTKSNLACSRDHPYYWGLTNRMLCGQAVGNTFCSGDSGGPWVTKVGSNYVLTGVSSWSRLYEPAVKDCPPGEPSIAARVTNQLKWIKDNMEGSTCPRL